MVMNALKCLLAMAAIVALSGCSNMTEIIAKREALYAPAKLHAGGSSGPARVAFRKAEVAAARNYSAQMTVPEGIPIKDYVDSGIAASNSDCRDWFARLNGDASRWNHDEANLNLVGNAITALLGAVEAPYKLIAGYGIAATAITGYNTNFQATILAMSDPDLQMKVRQIMTAQAATLRARSEAMTYPEALNALEEYHDLCSAQTAHAAVKSALGATVTTATPTGVLKSVAKEQQP